MPRQMRQGFESPPTRERLLPVLPTQTRPIHAQEPQPILPAVRERVEPVKACGVEGCPNPSRARGWCHAHYERWRKYGDPLSGSTYPRKRPIEGEADPRHGTVNGYVNYQCRCQFCKAAWTEYRRKWNNATPERRKKINDYERNRRKRASA